MYFSGKYQVMSLSITVTWQQASCYEKQTNSSSILKFVLEAQVELLWLSLCLSDSQALMHLCSAHNAFWYKYKFNFFPTNVYKNIILSRYKFSGKSVWLQNGFNTVSFCQPFVIIMTKDTKFIFWSHLTIKIYRPCVMYNSAFIDCFRRRKINFLKMAIFV